MGRYSKQWERLAAKAKAYYQDHPEIIVCCWRCREPIEMYLPHNHKRAFTMDHIIPKVLGGQDIQANAVPAHRGCNSRRARLIERSLSIKECRNRTVQLIRSTREW